MTQYCTSTSTDYILRAPKKEGACTVHTYAFKIRSTYDNTKDLYAILHNLGPRLPTAIATVPEQGLVVVGFDSGEVQCYSGLPGELRVGSGFRVSHGDPVRLVRTLEKHVTLDSDLEKDEDDCRAVSTRSYQLLVLVPYEYINSTLMGEPCTV